MYLEVQLFACNFSILKYSVCLIRIYYYSQKSFTFFMETTLLASFSILESPNLIYFAWAEAVKGILSFIIGKILWPFVRISQDARQC